jgi:aspartate racemase
MSTQKIIGVVGGMGPYAGLDLVKKIFDQTAASSDQEHLPVILCSLPSEIEDRTAFVLGESTDNPAWSILKVVRKLGQAGATVAGIPCNTAHAPRIFDVIQDELRKGKDQIKLLHMIEEVAGVIRERFPNAKKIGLLSTIGTAKARIYQAYLEPEGYAMVLPDEDIQVNFVHRPIYDREFGIKAKSAPVTDIARARLAQAIDHLLGRGVEVIILGCTEIPLAITEKERQGIPLLDPAVILARALIRETHPEKLVPLAGSVKSVAQKAPLL